MKRTGSVIAAALAVAAGGATIAACGSGESSSSSGGGGEKSGGTIRIGSILPDKYDPTQQQTIQANQALQLVYTGLLTFKHVQGKDGATLVPGVATALPKVSDGGKTYQLTLQKGLKYSDGSPVKASDFENTIKRLVVTGGPYSSFLTGIIGTDKLKSCSDDISGITTNDSTGAITIKLAAPDTKFSFALANTYAAPTPAAKSPCKPMQSPPPPGYGSYNMKIANPTREFTLTKNPNFKLPGIPAGKVDKIVVTKESVEKMTQDVETGKLDFMTEDPTGDQLPDVRRRFPDRISLAPNPPNVYYFFMNTTVAPFNKIEARKAVNYALDSRALQRIFSGRLDPTCNFIPKNVIGYQEATDCPYGDPAGAGNLTKAKELVKQSGTAGQAVTVWTNSKSPRPAIGDYLRGVLNQIGYKATLKTLDQQVYFDQVGQKRNKAQIGFTDWYMDFPHPSDLLEPAASADALASSPTFNESFINDPVLTKKINQLKEQDPNKVADQYAALDKYIVQDKAYYAPYGIEQSTSFFSERMNSKECRGLHPVYKNDWSQFCLKK